jgi:hypothetical protein
VATNTQAMLAGSVSCQRLGIQTVSISEYRSGAEYPIGTIITNGVFSVPLQVTGSTGNRPIRIAAQGPFGNQSRILQINVAEVMIF